MSFYTSEDLSLGSAEAADSAASTCLRLGMAEMRVRFLLRDFTHRNARVDREIPRDVCG